MAGYKELIKKNVHLDHLSTFTSIEYFKWVIFNLVLIFSLYPPLQLTQCKCPVSDL